MTKETIKNLFEEYFGEDLVYFIEDIEKYLEEDRNKAAYSTYYSTVGSKLYEIIDELEDKSKAKDLSAVILKIPELNIVSERGFRYTSKGTHLLIVFNAYEEGTSLHGIYISKYSRTTVEESRSFIHPHSPTSSLCYVNSICVGSDSDFRSWEISAFRGLTEIDLVYFLHNIIPWLSHESNSGVPYISIENVLSLSGDTYKKWSGNSSIKGYFPSTIYRYILGSRELNICNTGYQYYISESTVDFAIKITNLVSEFLNNHPQNKHRDRLLDLYTPCTVDSVYDNVMVLTEDDEYDEEDLGGEGEHVFTWKGEKVFSKLIPSTGTNYIPLIKGEALSEAYYVLTRLLNHNGYIRESI